MPLELRPAADAVRTRRSVVLVVCQVRFEETPSVSEKTIAPRFHELLGGAEGPYPRVNRAEIASGIAMTLGPEGPIAEPRRTSGWRMHSADGAWLVGLFPGHVALQTQQYAGWDDFSDRLATVLNAAVEVVEPVFAQRIALRLVDQITGLGVDSPAGWEPYIAPQFLGPLLLSGLGTSVRAAEQQLVIDVGDSVTCTLNHAATESSDGVSDYMFDSDVFRDGSHPFDVERIQSVVLEFKDHADRLFGAATSRELLERLQ
jgi:uncharacterized protein (TIGR04255 family)